MLQAGDNVFIEDSAQIDINFFAWLYISTHREAVVKQRMSFIEHDDAVPESEHLYALEFSEDFQGGHNCQENCANHRGQFVAAKHLSLKFEESREVCTVPNIPRPVCQEQVQ